MSDANNKAVFLSYASEDAAAVQRIGDALRQAGVEVWFDQNELRGGDAWDQKIRRQIRECALFVPIISANAQARPEGYFRLEWRLAEQRSHLIAHGRPFIVPVVIDDTEEAEALVPEVFLAVQWTRVKSDDALPAFAGQVGRLLQRLSGSVMPSGVPRADPGVRGDRPPLIPDFELLRIIGRGAYGDVWLARGLTGIYRAIKLVWRDRFPNAEPFEREFKGLRQFMAMELPEAGQLALLHVGQNEAAGFFYYVMELADDGHTGRAINPATYAPLTLRELRLQRGRLPAAEGVRIGVELARALAGLHERGCVHRDIKPSNVILVGGVPKLADIGLVTFAADALTYVGTEGYVPPEGPGKPAADVYALGRLLYELVTGLDREEFPRLPPELDRVPDRKRLLELNEIILRACEPGADRRYRDAGALLADLLRLEEGNSLRGRRARAWARGAGIGLAAAALIAVGAVVRTGIRPAAGAGPVAAAADSKAIAVLPFRNMSADKGGNAFFADGVHEDILTNLTHIAALRVVSRTSVEQYRNTKLPLRQIARELGVAWVLEGSVQRAGNRVHVTGQLVDARTDGQVWAESYDRDLTDVFAIQAELATKIAAALNTALSPREQRLLERRPTTNAAAYDLFLKARAVNFNAPSSSAALHQREALLAQAVQLDPAFGLAWGELAEVHAFFHFSQEDVSAARLAQAREAIEAAQRLAPDAPEVIRNLGTYYYYALRDFARATEQYEKLARLQPNDPTVHYWAGMVQRRQSRWTEALANFRQAVQLEPTNLKSARALFLTLTQGRRYDEAIVEGRRLVGLANSHVEDAHALAHVYFLATGSTREMEEFFSGLSAEQAGAPRIVDLRARWAADKGDIAEVLRLDRLQPYFDGDAQPHYQQAVNAAVAYTAKGDWAGAQARVAPFLADLRAGVEANPTNAELRAYLGVYEALFRHPDEAVQCARQAVALLPESQDALFGAEYRSWLSVVYTLIGDKERAIAELAWLLRAPSPDGYPNVHEMRLSYWYAPLRGDPRFEALMNDPKNNEPLF